MSAQNNLDKLVLNIFGKNKIFCESGGAHPETQSNTFLLEKNDWHGLVVEPWEGYNQQYNTIRPKTILENYALVGKDYKDEYIDGTFSSDFGGSVIEGAHNNPWNPKPYKAITLTKLLKKHSLTNIHFMSIDVEGYEHEVLSGIDFNEINIHLLVVEKHWYGGFDYLSDFNFNKVLTISNQEIYFNRNSEFYKENL